MLKDEIIEVEIKRQNINYYISKGFACNVGDKICIYTHDLPNGSTKRIITVCDYCGEEVSLLYRDYVKNISGIIHKYSCKKCKGLKTKESNLIKYGVDSVMKVEEIKIKLQETNMKKYGVRLPAQSPKVIHKMKDTMIERYGTDSAMCVEEFRKKQKKTLFENYGVDSPLHSDLIKQKVIKTNMTKYGVPNPFQNKQIQEKQKQTCMKKYGCENVFQNEEIKRKSKLTLINKYNSDHPMHIKAIKDKVIRKGLQTKYKYGTVSCSKQQKHIHILTGGKLNYPIDKLSLDIAFPENKIYIEYNGSGHDIDVKYGRISKHDFEEKDIKRYKYLKSLGWKEIEIESKNDYLLYDNLLISIINKSKNELLSTDINHIVINIDDYDIDQKYKLKSSTS